MSKRPFWGRMSFRRILVSFMLVFLLPTIIMATLVRVSFVNTLYDRAVAELFGELEYTKLVVDNKLMNFAEIVDFIMMDDSYNDKDLPRDYLSFIQLQKNLSTISMANDLISELALYIEGSDHILSLRSSYQLRYFSLMHTLDGIGDEAALYEYLNLTDQVSVLHGRRNRNGEPMTVFVFPAKPVRYNAARRVALFITEAANYHSALKKTLGGNEGCAFLLDENQGIISYVNTDASTPYEEYYRILTQTMSGDEDRLVNGGEKYIRKDGYAVARLHSDFLRLSYYVVVSDQVLSAQTAELATMWFVMIAVVAALGFLLSIFIGKLNYSPIASLRDKAHAISGNTTERLGDDYSYLYETMEYMNLQSSLLQNNIDEINDYLLFKLFKGDINNEEEAGRLGKLIEFPLNGSSFRAGVVKTFYQSGKRGVLAALESRLPEGSRLLIRGDSNVDMYNLAIISPDGGAGEGPILNGAPDNCAVALGEAVPEIRLIPLSCAQALCAFERQSEGAGLRVFTREGALGQWMNSIEEAYGRMDLPAVIDLIKDIQERLEKDGMTAGEVKVLYILATINLVQLCERKEAGIGQAELPAPFTILSLRGTEQLARMAATLTGVLEAVHAGVLPRPYDPAHQMIAYIKSHYRDLGFSFQKMAFEFNLPLSVLSHQFSELVGMNLMDYITDLRLSTAKELLKNTQVSVGEIAMEIGYYNVNSFIRRFKQITGVTPGDYRKQSREDGGEVG